MTILKVGNIDLELWLTNSSPEYLIPIIEELSISVSNDTSSSNISKRWILVYGIVWGKRGSLNKYEFKGMRKA